jgi:hypothetical protein
MPLVKGMRGIVRNVRARAKAVRSGTTVSPRKSLPAKLANLRPLLSPNSRPGVNSSGGAPGRSGAGHPVVVRLDTCSKLVMLQLRYRVLASAYSVAKSLLIRASKQLICRGWYPGKHRRIVCRIRLHGWTIRQRRCMVLTDSGKIRWFFGSGRSWAAFVSRGPIRSLQNCQLHCRGSSV